MIFLSKKDFKKRYIEWDEKNIDEIITFNTDYILKNFYEVKEKFISFFSSSTFMFHINFSSFS